MMLLSNFTWEVPRPPPVLLTWLQVKECRPTTLTQKPVSLVKVVPNKLMCFCKEMSIQSVGGLYTLLAKDVPSTLLLGKKKKTVAPSRLFIICCDVVVALSTSCS